MHLFGLASRRLVSESMGIKCVRPSICTSTKQQPQGSPEPLMPFLEAGGAQGSFCGLEMCEALESLWYPSLALILASLLEAVGPCLSFLKDVVLRSYCCWWGRRRLSVQICRLGKSDLSRPPFVFCFSHYAIRLQTLSFMECAVQVP